MKATHAFVGYRRCSMVSFVEADEGRRPEDLREWPQLLRDGGKVERVTLEDARRAASAGMCFGCGGCT